MSEEGEMQLDRKPASQPAASLSEAANGQSDVE